MSQSLMSAIIYVLKVNLKNVKKVGRAVTFMSYLPRVVSLIFPLKTLVWNKITFPASDLMNFTELVKNELMKSISQKNYQYSFFYPKLITKELDKFTKILISIVSY